MDVFRVGLLFFQETFGRELLHRLSHINCLHTNKKNHIRLQAEHIAVHEMNMNQAAEYDLLIDRASHYFKLGIPYCMMHAFQGVKVVNNPMSFHFFMERKDVGYYIAHNLGIKVPPTYILPTCRTPFFKSDEDFQYHKHFNWNEILAEVGFPCVLKPANGRGAHNVHICHEKGELMMHYQTSGSELMVLQKKVESPHPWLVRCLCIGRQIVPIAYIFRTGDQSEYLNKENFLPRKTINKIINSARIINRAFGYEMNSVEFVIDHEGEPWAIDFNNPVPDGRISALGEHWYNRYLELFTDFIIHCAENRDQNTTDFLPGINHFSEIARMSIPQKEKFQIALEAANQYYT
jgi:hypothetical protein